MLYKLYYKNEVGAGWQGGECAFQGYVWGCSIVGQDGAGVSEDVMRCDNIQALKQQATWI